MGRNPEWFDQVRARGICYICQRPMEDDDPRRVHGECEQARQTRTYAEIRRDPPPLVRRPA